MIKFRRMLYWNWRPSANRIPMGFQIYVPGLMIQIGHHNPPCRVCGTRDEIYVWDENNPGAAICVNCCDHPDYQYDRGDRDYFCVECGEAAPYEWVDWVDYHSRCDDDVCISFAGSRDPGQPIGTPISELSGRPGHDGYEKFVQIAKSWGYD